MATLRKPTKETTRDESQGKTSEQFVADKQGDLTSYFSSKLNRFLFRSTVEDQVKRHGGLVKADMGTEFNFDEVLTPVTTASAVIPPVNSFDGNYGFNTVNPNILSGKPADNLWQPSSNENTLPVKNEPYVQKGTVEPSVLPSGTIQAKGAGSGYTGLWETPGATSPSLAGKPQLNPQQELVTQGNPTKVVPDPKANGDINTKRSLADQQKPAEKPDASKAGNFLSSISPPDPGMIIDLFTESMRAEEERKKKKFYENQMQIANTVPKYYGSRGDYDVNQGNFRPDRRLATGKKGGQFGDGGTKQDNVRVATKEAPKDWDTRKHFDVKKKVYTDAEAEAWAKKAETESRAEAKLQHDKDWVAESTVNTLHHPVFNAAQYATPEGLALAALQGAVKLGPDMVAGKKLDSAVDVASILPMGVIAAKYATGAKRLSSDSRVLKLLENPKYDRSVEGVKKGVETQHSDTHGKLRKGGEKAKTKAVATHGGESELPQAFWGALVSLIPAVMGMMNKNKEAQTAQVNQDTAVALAKKKELDVQQQNSLGMAQGFQQNALQQAPLYKKGGAPKYKKGGTYELSDKEVADLVRQGYDIEFAD